MCDPITATALAVGGSAGLSIYETRQEFRAVTEAAHANLVSQYTQAEAEGIAIRDQSRRDIQQAASTARYNEAAVESLAEGLGLTGQASEILAREQRAGTNKDLNAISENAQVELNQITNFKRNARSQYDTSIRTAKDNFKTGMINAVVGGAQAGLSAYGAAGGFAGNGAAPTGAGASPT